MKRILLAFAALATLALTSCNEEAADNGPIAISIDELNEVFNYTFPLVIMDATKTAETNAEVFVPGIQRAPINQLIHDIKPIDASSTLVATPSIDTYHSRLWMDLSQEPIVLEFPNIEDRVFNIQVLDAWTNTAKVIYKGGTYVFALKGRKTRVPAGATLVELSTALNWAIFRIVDKGEDDYANVKMIQDAMKVYPLSAYGNACYEAPRGKYVADNDYNPVQHCLNMSVGEYFAKVNELMVKNPPLSSESQIINRLKRLGIGAGLEFKGFKNDEQMFISIKAGFNVYASHVDLQRRTYLGGMWSYFVDPIGNLDTDYGYRAAAAMIGLAANTTDMTILPHTDNDRHADLAFVGLADNL